VLAHFDFLAVKKSLRVFNMQAECGKPSYHPALQEQCPLQAERSHRYGKAVSGWEGFLLYLNIVESNGGQSSTISNRCRSDSEQSYAKDHQLSVAMPKHTTHCCTALLCFFPPD
jgi:hypothetical protein